MLASMQSNGATGTTLATKPRAEADTQDRTALTRDMFAFASHLLRRSHVRTFNTIAELDLSFTQIKALCAMDEGSEQFSVKALAESMGVSLAAMSRAVDGLYERGFVDRQEDPADRRMKRVQLTDAGRSITRTLTEGRLAGIEEFLASLGDDEAEALASALELIVERRPEIAELRPAQTTPAKRSRR
jgi:DNA-binding MarR family transcriptional regulator